MWPAKLVERIFSDAVPLAARVIVNRVWGWHFGRPLVGTPSDFGAQGEPPSHPELLDDLAARFIASGWSLKWLNREIVMSAAYTQASQPRLMLGRTMARKKIQMLRFTRRGAGYHVAQRTGTNLRSASRK